MFSEFAQSIPVPTLVGFFLSIVAALIGWIFSVSTFTVFLVLLALAWLFLFRSEYKLPISNHLMLIGLALLGYIPLALVQFLF